MSASQHLVIAGDSQLQLCIYPQENASSRPRTQMYPTGARLLALLLNGLKDHEGQPLQVHRPSLEHPEDPALHSIMEFEVSEKDADAVRLKQQILLDTEPRWHSPVSTPPSDEKESRCMWVVQDAFAGKSFNSNETQLAMDLLEQNQPTLFVYHVSTPLCSGAIWKRFSEGKDRNQEAMIAVIDVASLRGEGLELSRGLSWERTCEEFIHQLGSIGNFVTLATCPHLIVLFGCDGAIYHRGREAARPVLVFDPKGNEGDFVRRHLGPVPGLNEAFVAGFAASLAKNGQSSMLESIKRGLGAMRRLGRQGLVAFSNAHELIGELTRDDESREFIQFNVPSDDIARGCDDQWSILEHAVGDVSQLAQETVRQGNNHIAMRIPHAQFSKLALCDRREIESFRSLTQGVMHYLATPSIRTPYGVAVCGSVGAGKTFAMQQVIYSIVRTKPVHFLFCDFADMTDTDYLNVLLQSVRDCSIQGVIAAVHFHNTELLFNSSLAKSLYILLRLIREGTFIDNGSLRPVGQSIFFFEDDAWETLSDLQNPKKDGLKSFVASLRTSVTLLGPNQIDNKRGPDTLFPLRRAIILRSLLEGQIPGMTSTSRIDIDDRLLSGLLLVPKFTRAVQSMKAILDMSQVNLEHGFKPADLPPISLLSLHMEHDDFLRCMKGPILPAHIREEAAQKLHSAYLDERRRTASPGELNQLNLQEWHMLDEEFKESARAHVDSIPSKLRLVSCFLAERTDSRIAIQEFTPAQIEQLSIVEHDRWNSERLQKQWTIGERDPSIRQTPFLVPWSDLDEKFRDIDRALVAGYPSFLPSSYAIYSIGRLGDE
ncbi:hypothetical protein UA08_07776 [Talaromyces atroroseus]|uniref:Ryanodine receptor Ryr domain-containing protein n=1 Tax=Talaromyces atroroseus TaxID=1441469 RepID=A0A225AQT9_TALAT|nr:hypothetical protein UA08_07776 [Talaromyces atroroseus]OKL56795.1 hypothetical protein UA08_07776 [Talaromyces atroroseus]